MHKGIGPGSTIPLPNGGFMTMVYTPNEGTLRRLQLFLAETNPAAFSPEPVPHSLAEAMLRDGVVVAPEVIPLDDARGYNPPPNCDGNRGHDTYHAHEAPMPPAVLERLDGQDDDEGAPGEPPRCSTGGCGQD